MKPVGSTENYLKHYSDKFNYVDRVMAAIRYNNFRVENNLPSFMTNEQVRSDVIAGVTTGKSDIGQIFVAEGIEDTRGDLGELQAKINATEELIKSDKLDWKYIAGNQNPQNRETTILNYISRNQVDTAYPIGELQNAVGNPESEVTVKLSAVPVVSWFNVPTTKSKIICCVIRNSNTSFSTIKHSSYCVFYINL